MKNRILQINEDNDIKILFGSEMIKVVAKSPYNKDVINYLSALSKEILSNQDARKYSDIISFGFYIRHSNINLLAKKHVTQFPQQGKGLAFHIAPSNVPINFAYTFLFGLLSGNSNIVRIPSKYYAQYEIICRIMEQLSEKSEYKWVEETNAIICYPKDNLKATKYLSSICNVRVIWGGDQTIQLIRQFSLPPRTTEIIFSDRYSLAFISLDKIRNMSDTQLDRLAQDFYNDTYLMDQNACSSPHIIIWCLSSSVSLFTENVEQVNIPYENVHSIQDRFWKAVYNAAKKYNLEDQKVTEKYTMLCENAIAFDCSRIDSYSNLLYTVYLQSLPEDITQMRGKFGLFYNFIIYNMRQIENQIDSEKIQTISTYGIDMKMLSDYIIQNGILGADRIVPIGSTLNIGVIWDGYDIISMMSRNICTQD